jgi:hypothetical protein
MMPQEKERLLALLTSGARWCRGSEALDAEGHAVHFDDPSAVAWDVTGAICLLFGWQRATVLFEQLHRHIVGKRQTYNRPRRDAAIDAMVRLQEFNDMPETSFADLREQIESMVVWRGAGAKVESTLDAPAATGRAGPDE